MRGLWKAARGRLVRLLCRHPLLRVVAATGAEIHTPSTIVVGLTITCATCGRNWHEDVVARYPAAWQGRLPEGPPGPPGGLAN